MVSSVWCYSKVRCENSLFSWFNLVSRSPLKHMGVITKINSWTSTSKCNMYRKSYERECISWFMGTSDVLKVLKIARAVGECNLRTFKTSRVTINHEMHEQVHTIFYLLNSRQNYSNILSSCSCSYSSIFGFTFRRVAHVCQTFNQVCVAFNVFLFFAFSLSCSTMFWFGGKSAIQIWSMIYIIVLITCVEGRS